MKRAVLLLGCFGLFSARAAVTNLEPSVVGSEALGTLRQLVDQSTFRQFGFRSLPEVQRANLGTALPVRTVKLSALREYPKGGPATNLIIDTGKIIYPVVVNGQVRCSITLRRNAGGWKATSYGSPAMSQDAVAARAKVASASHVPVQSCFAVEIPSFNALFIARDSQEGIILTSVWSDPDLNLCAGQSLPAEIVFQLLTPAAKRRNNKPG